jgi:hypothetical protein
MLNTSFMRAALSKMYSDVVSVKRYSESVSAIGRTSIDEVVVYSNIPCRLSKKSPSANMQTESSNTLDDSAMLYLDKQYIIRQGDELYLTHIGRSYHFQAGEPFVYESHQEIVISRKDYA